MNGNDHYADANPLGGNKSLQKLQQRYRYLLDKTTPHTVGRWVAWALLLVIYGLRTWYLKGKQRCRVSCSTCRCMEPSHTASLAIF